MSESRHPEYQYLDLLRHIWENGTPAADRTGVGTRVIFGTHMRFSLENDQIPLITTKKVSWKTAFREMLWFLTGSTNIKPLVEQGVHIWTDWPLEKYRKATGEAINRDDFEAKILASDDFAKKWGDLGPIYGAQWTNWAQYTSTGDGSGLFRREEKGINQIDQVIDGLINNPFGRRHIMTGWNVAELNLQSLPSCHMVYQWQTDGKKLNSLLFQRSGDSYLGIVYNLITTAMLTRMIAQQTGLEPGELIWMGGDTHIYLNHEAAVNQQLSRTPRGTPKLRIKRKPNSIYDYKIDDFEVYDYEPHGAISAPVAV